MIVYYNQPGRYDFLIQFSNIFSKYIQNPCLLIYDLDLLNNFIEYELCFIVKIKKFKVFELLKYFIFLFLIYNFIH